jgi:FkbM family methyltransferase
MKLLNLLYNPRIRRLITRHRQNWLVRWLNDFSVLYHQTYENRNYNFHDNGEAFVLKKVQAHSVIKTVFDVGANVGDWSAIAAGLFPEAKIYAFEILPNIFAQLEDKLKITHNVKAYNVGLSDKEEETLVNYVEANSALSTCLDDFSEEFHGLTPKREHCQTITGDIFCERNSIQQIDFLKIDVEGFEGKVLKGFEGLLKKGAVKAIQFEYGYASLSSNFFLKDFYKLFNHYNMTGGKIYPAGVDFSSYNYMKEDFIGPNYLAIQRSEVDLIKALTVN